MNVQTHEISRTEGKYVYCTCGAKFGPGPFKVKALRIHAKAQGVAA